MASTPFDYTALLRADLPPAAARWNGLPRHHFVGGNNDEASVPVDDLVAAAERVLRRDGHALALYGLKSGPLGYRPLREFIAAKLQREAAIAVSPDDILITSGSLQGLDLVNAVLLAPGDTAIVEEMTYGGAISRLKRLGVNVVGVPVDKDGLSAEALSQTLAELAAKGVRPKYIYTIPTVQNPTATVMSEGRRKEIIALSRQYGVPIFEDECYSDLVWEGRRPAAMRAMTDDGSVIHIGSFSKSIAPALRVGYIVADWPVMSRILAVKTDAGSGALEQMVLAEFCPKHFDTHVQTLRSVLKGKLDVMVESVRSQFGETADIEFDYPAGGIFLWLRMPDSVDTSRLEQIALRAGVAINPGAEWMTDAVGGRKRLRLCFAHPTHEVIREGVGMLAEICRREFGVPPVPAGAHR
ncbi:MAG: PLP-dependent aminotransferase family protein [Betaproteobacteria bacterium]|nr:PLP-dependent aminotransferase family protein [Betaproteobacteria bacterium]